MEEQKTSTITDTTFPQVSTQILREASEGMVL